MSRAAVLSLLFHFALAISLRHARIAPPKGRATVELEVISRPAIAPRPTAAAASPARAPDVIPRTRGGRATSHPAVASLMPRASASSGAPSATAPPEPSQPPASAPNLFSPSALGHAAGVDVEGASPSGFRPRHGVGGIDGRGGVAVSDFLAEDAGRERAQKGLVPPFVREMERQLDGFFDPPFAHVDNANRKELMHKQFMGFLKTPPKTGELRRGVDPTKETTEEKLRSTGDRAFFLGRRVLVFARQRADGSVAELSVRQSSGFHAFDDDAIAAVERALAARPPRAGELKNGEVRTLWQLDATGYVVIAPEPTLKFDESTGKSEWIYPLQKRVDKAVKLVAVY